MEHHVLIIEGDPATASVVQEALAGAGEGSFVVEWVKQLADGLESLKREMKTAVFLDLFLPDSQGIDTFVKLSLAAPYVPIVVLGDLREEETANSNALSN
jgi:DNA-binding response OmpR family regulator